MFSLDVRNDDSVQKAKDFVESKLQGKKLWAVVNNAGIGDMRGSENSWTFSHKDIYTKL